MPGRHRAQTRPAAGSRAQRKSPTRSMPPKPMNCGAGLMAQHPAAKVETHDATDQTYATDDEQRSRPCHQERLSPCGRPAVGALVQIDQPRCAGSAPGLKRYQASLQLEARRCGRLVEETAPVERLMTALAARAPLPLPSSP